MSTLFSAIPPLGYILGLLCIFNLQKQIVFFGFVWNKGWGFLQIVSVKFQLSGNLQFPQCMFYLKTKASYVLKHF